MVNLSRALDPLDLFPMPTKPHRPFDREKAIEVLKFIATHAPKPDLYWVLKILYQADKLHLQKYGRFICGDDYVAMKHGPVPSCTYDLLKEVRMYNSMPELHPAPEDIEIQDGGYRVVPLRDPDMDLFSESDIECLIESIQIYGNMTFTELKEASHDHAYLSVGENDFIDIEQIISTFPNAKAILENVRDCSYV